MSAAAEMPRVWRVVHGQRVLVTLCPPSDQVPRRPLEEMAVRAPTLHPENSKPRRPQKRKAGTEAQRAEALAMLLAGKTQREVAKVIGVSQWTVKSIGQAAGLGRGKKAKELEP